MKLNSDIFKILFDKFTLREKVLFSALCWIAVFIWLSFTIGRFSDLRAKLNIVNQTLGYQELWLNSAESIEAQLEIALSKVNPEKTYNSAQLVGKIDAYARQLRLNHELSSPKTQHGEIFDLHTLTISVRGKTLENLIEFNKKVQSEFPYIALEQLTLNASKSNPTLLDARFTINSFELNKQTSQ